MAFPQERPRRLRRTPALRRLSRETAVSAADLVLPLFIREGMDSPQPIAALPGHRHETVESARETVGRAVESGISAVLLFGLPEDKDEDGSGAWNPQGGVQLAAAALREEFGDRIALIADCCLCEYTSHGHCGVLRDDGSVDNDATLERYARTAVSLAEAGADIVAPSGMMDGQVGAVRSALDGAGHQDVAIMAYSAKFASVMYGPFRDAAACAPQEGDRRGYQMDPANAREAVRESLLDIAEGADIVMVKPALTCLDVVAAVRAAATVPLAAYVVSGEFAMIHQAAAAGAFDECRAALETLGAVRRAGADIVVTYHALAVARALQEQLER
ncbi:MAG: porphobilinogen synthase [Candidatus Dormibacteraeota bacterium]|nr:porphobilinogen synthase [Candidatus Dormibacteraeota bacterium]